MTVSFRVRASALLLGVAPLSMSLAVASATPVQKADDAPFLTFYSAGADAFLKSPKDRWLADAIRRLERDGVQLPPEMQRQFDATPQGRIAASLIRDLFTTRIAGSFGLASSEPGEPPMPKGQLTLLGNDRRPGGSIETDIISALKMSGMWSAFKSDPATPGFRQFNSGEGPPAWFGTMDMGGRSATVLSVGQPPIAAQPSFERFGLAAGVEPQFAFELDFAPLQPLLQMAAMMLPEGPDGRSPLESMGVVGPNPIAVRMTMSNDGREGHIDATIVNGAKSIPNAQFGAGNVTKADLQWIPADAKSAWMGRSNLSATLLAMIDQYNAQLAILGMNEDGDFDDGADDGMNNGDDGMGGDRGAADGKSGTDDGMIDQWVHNYLGLDLRRELIAPLGEVMATHHSTSLGGGFYSSVFLCTLKDSPTMSATLGKLSKALAAVPDATNAGIVMKARSHPSCEALYSLTAAGLPIPFQVAVGIGNGAIVFGLTPESVIRAIEQAKATNSIMDHPGFKEMNGTASVTNGVSLGWIDAPSTMRQGYGMLLALATALDSCMLRADGEPAPVDVWVPSMDELAKGAKPTLVVGHVKGDDILWNLRCDPSFSVQAAAVGGYLQGGSMMSLAIFGGALLPALSKAQESAGAARREAMEVRHARDADDDAQGAAMGAHNSRVTSTLRSVGMAVMVYANDNNDQLPDGFDELIEMGALDHEPISTRSVEGLTGEISYKKPAAQFSSIREPSSTLLAWEEFTQWPEGGVFAVFADGHVDLIDSEAEFRTFAGQ